MLRVQVEIHPCEDAERKRVIAVIDFGSVPSTGDESDYLVRSTIDEIPQPPFRINGHRRADGWAPLLTRALKQLGLFPSK